MIDRGLGALIAAGIVAVAATGCSSSSGPVAPESSTVRSTTGDSVTTSSTLPIPTGDAAFTAWWDRWTQDPCSVLTEEDLAAVGLYDTEWQRYPTRSVEWTCDWRTQDVLVAVSVSRGLQALDRQTRTPESSAPQSHVSETRWHTEPHPISGRRAYLQSETVKPRGIEQTFWIALMPVGGDKATVEIAAGVSPRCPDCRTIALKLAAILIDSGSIAP